MNRVDKAGERRTDKLGPIRCMADAQNYVMVRRPGCMPFVLARRDWLKLPLYKPEKEAEL